MCGIVGYVGHRNAVPILLDGLCRLEYRGYDSAGMAVLTDAGTITVRKREGKIASLQALLAEAPPSGRLGVGHTRWATHGAPTTPNAHPHLDGTGRVAVVHNGIIENYAELRAELISRGFVFASETDTEVIAHLVADAMAQATSGSPTGNGHELSATDVASGNGRGANATNGDYAPDHAPDDAPTNTPDGAPDSTPGGIPLGAPHVPPPCSPDGTPDDELFVRAVRQAVGRLEGSFAIATFTTDRPDLLVAARRYSPLVVGLGADQSYLASDIPALLPETRRVLFLEDGELAVLRPDQVRIVGRDGRTVDRAPLEVTWDAAAAEKGGYEHFVRKEIDEQPTAIAETLRGRVSGETIRLPELDEIALDGVDRVYMVAAGTSLYAGLVGKMQMERWARLPVELLTASEMRYGDPVLGPNTLVVLISQSGETADTLAAARSAKEASAPTLAITNVVGSTITRTADVTLFLQAGPEIGVVATKTFTSQLALLTLLSAFLGARRGQMDGESVRGLAHDLRTIPEAVAEAIASEDRVADIARIFAERRSMFFMGRRFGHPVALEGALKLKEISYIHAEGYPAGELKHGPIAMLDSSIPVFTIVTAGPTYEKTISNIEEVRTRGAEVIAVASEGDTRIAGIADHVIYVPRVREELTPIVDVVPTQLFAYHVAVVLGRDVDQPRNLAKSVTVE